MTQLHVSELAQAAKLETKVTLKLLEGLNTPVSLSAWILIRNGELRQLLEKDVNPLDYNCPNAFADDYLAVEILKKSRVQKVDVDTKAKALEAFFEAEQYCREANANIEDIVWNSTDRRDDFATLVRVRARIEEIVGIRLYRRDLNEIEDNFAFGPGSTYDLKTVITMGRKFGSHRMTTTPQLASYALHALPRLWRERVNTIDIVDGNRWMCVPKNWKTDRGICAEPTLNIYVQKGIGAWLRRRLKLSGVDLSTQERNRRLAREGSADNELCTLDLSMASDTICWSAVRHLISNDNLFDLLEAARSPKTLTPGGANVRLQKFSSMGNGYTFELETLLFSGVVRSVVPKELWCLTAVYGDDMIFPSRYKSEIVRVLDLLGFKINQRKTFGEGPFRESCGADFFMGTNVRPFYLRTTHEDPIESAYIMMNLISEYAHKRNNGIGRDGRFLPAWLTLFSELPVYARIDVPPSYSSQGVVWLSKDRRDGPHSFIYRKVILEKKIVSSEGLLLASLAGANTDFSKGREVLRGRRTMATFKAGVSLDSPGYQEWY